MLVARSRIEGGHHRLFARRRRRSSQPWRSWQRCAMASLTNSWEAACALVHGPLHCQGQEEEKEASKKEEDGGCRTEQDLKRPCCTLLTTPRLVRTSSVVSEAPSRRRQTAVSRFVLEALKSPHTLTLQGKSALTALAQGAPEAHPPRLPARPAPQAEKVASEKYHAMLSSFGP